MDAVRVREIRGLQGVKEARVRLGATEIGVAAVSGLANARRLMQEVRAGRSDLAVIEVMACPGGCVNGGGQPIGADLDAVRARMKALYDIDRDSAQRTSHGNVLVRRLYDEDLGQPGSEAAHHLLHTHYHPRDVEV